MVMTVDEPGNNSHLAAVELLRVLPNQRPDLRVTSDCGEPAGLDGERFGFWRLRIDSVNFRVEDDEIHIGAFAGPRCLQSGSTEETRDTSSGDTHEFPAGVVTVFHESSCL